MKFFTIILSLISVTVLATPITVTDNFGHTLTIYPINELPNTASPSNNWVFVVEDPTERKFNITQAQFMSLIGTNSTVINSLSTNVSFINNLFASPTFTSNLINSSIYNAYLSTNAAVASNILFTIFPEKYNSTITQSQTNYVYDDVLKRQTFTCASSITLTITAASTNSTQPVWGFANQGGWTSYLLSTNNTIVLQNTNKMTILSVMPTIPTNGVIFCSQHGNTVVVGYCPVSR